MRFSRRVEVKHAASPEPDENDREETASPSKEVPEMMVGLVALLALVFGILVSQR